MFLLLSNIIKCLTFVKIACIFNYDTSLNKQMKGIKMRGNKRIIDVVMTYIKKSGKKGRTYTEILKHVCSKVYGWPYDYEMDRGAIAHCYATIQDNCKKKDSRYIYCG